MRVITGRFKGRRLRPPAWDGLRPTSDKLRETLFNILGTRVAGAHVLDGFAGTGALGIEALSRGAAHVAFVERSRRAAALVAANLSACGVQDGYTIHHGDVVSVLRRHAGAAFDLILLDPPYDIASFEDVLAAASSVVRPDGLVVLERATRREPTVPSSLVRTRDVVSGDSALTFFVPAAEAQTDDIVEGHDRET